MRGKNGRVLKAVGVLCKCAEQTAGAVKDFTEMLSSLHAQKVQQANALKFMAEAEKSDRLFAEARRLQNAQDPRYRKRRFDALNAWQNAVAHNRGEAVNGMPYKPPHTPDGRVPNDTRMVPEDLSGLSGGYSLLNTIVYDEGATPGQVERNRAEVRARTRRRLLAEAEAGGEPVSTGRSEVSDVDAARYYSSLLSSGKGGAIFGRNSVAAERGAHTAIAAQPSVDTDGYQMLKPPPRVLSGYTGAHTLRERLRQLAGAGPRTRR